MIKENILIGDGIQLQKFLQEERLTNVGFKTESIRFVINVLKDKIEQI